MKPYHQLIIGTALTAAAAAASAQPDAATSTSAAPSASAAQPPITVPPPPPPIPLPSASASKPAPSFDTCTENIPSGKERPSLAQIMPNRGLAGHAVTLRVTVVHGKGERVLPFGFLNNLTDEQRQQLDVQGFAVPHPDGGAGPTIESKDITEGPKAGRRESVIRLGFVPLPKEPGRQRMTLPPVPIGLERASGELVVLCTQPAELDVDPPIANTPDPASKPNPPPRRQRELWEAARNAAIGVTAGLAFALLAAWLYSWYRRRPKPVPPPPPARKPWLVAMEELHDVRQAKLVQQERFSEHYDRVCDILRRYVGARYGYDFQEEAGALESTTAEILEVLSRVTPRIPVLDRIEEFFRSADLVKFANLTPSAEECAEALANAELIVSKTVPDGGGLGRNDAAPPPTATPASAPPQPTPAAEPTPPKGATSERDEETAADAAEGKDPNVNASEGAEEPDRESQP